MTVNIHDDNRLRRHDVPQCTLVGAFIYPIKSMRGVQVSHLQIHNGRILNDRSWVVVDTTFRRLSSRKHPRLATISVNFDGAGISLSRLATASIAVTVTDEIRSIRLTDQVTDAAASRADRAVSDWLSDYLGVDCHLFKLSGQAAVELAPMPIHIVSRNSVDDLNARLSAPIPEERFRPNVVVTGLPPYAEDTWSNFGFDGVPMRKIRNCDRCAVPNIDQETGVLGAEPLKTLGSYRRRECEIHFGIYARPTCDGRISIGSPLRIFA
jgi:hypothetical protein